MAGLRHNSYFNSENQPFQKIIVSQTDGQTKASCSCCCYLEVRSVTASLSHVGYLPFTCEGQGPPDTDTRYLKYRASGDGYIEACGVAPQHQDVTQEWTVDPFTGLTCYNGPESAIVSSGCSELQNCSATQKSYSCAFEGDPGDPCTPAQEGVSINWTESLQDSYTIEDVSSNVDTVLGRINPYGNDGMPAGTRGSVINGTNGSILTWVNDCALNRAEYTSGSGGVTKTKLFVKFTKATQYTLTQSNGSVQTLEATEGQEITVDPPSEPNTWTDIAIVQKTKVGCCNSSIGATTHTGQTTDSTFVPDEEEGQPPPPTPFIGPDCKAYSTRITESEQSSSSNQTFGFQEGGYTQEFSASYSFQSNSSTTESIYGQTTETSSSTTTYSDSGSLSFNNNEGTQWTSTGSTNISLADNNGVCSGSYSSNYVSPEGESEDFSCNPCTDNNCSIPSVSIPAITWGCPQINGASVTVTGSGKIERSSESSGEIGSGYSTTTSNINATTTITYSGEITNQNQLQTGTWEEETSPNESLCASRSESLTTKTSSNVAAAIELTFTAPASETPINYEHWFHYYTIEADNSEQGCPTSEVVAHNEKWTSVSSGGMLNLSRSINLSTPPKDHSICAQGLAFVTRVAS